LKVREIKEIKEIKAKVVPTKKVPKICSKWCLVSFLQGLACTKGLAILRASHLFTSSVETLEPLREDMKGHGLTWKKGKRENRRRFFPRFPPWHHAVQSFLFNILRGSFLLQKKSKAPPKRFQ